MKYTAKIVLLLFVLSSFISCGTKKNNIFNRAYNSMAAKYNILYNGNLAYQEGLAEIKAKHKDNFRAQLVLEPITFENDESVVSNFKNSFNQPKTQEKQTLTPFEKAEEKATKAIQQYSMLIDGRERNNQIDDAYLLLGKSRYYTQRFAPAIDAFNYSIKNYPFASEIDETRIWRAKANIRINNESLAIETLFIVLNKRTISDKTREAAHTTLAMAYLKTQNTAAAISQLILATKTQINKDQTARNLFVLGQLYQQKDNREAAVATFTKLIHLKDAPYIFVIHAQIEIAKLLSDKGKLPNSIAQFKKMLVNAKNEPYLDELYYQLGLLEQQRDSTQLAVAYFKKSAAAVSTNPYQKTFPFEKLGDISFKKSDFILAGAYYDSVVQLAVKSNEPRIRAIRRKHENLSNLINFENVLKNNDSILYVVSLPKEQQRAYYEAYIKELKAAAKKKAEEQINQQSFGSGLSNANSLQSTNKGKWYFYNTQLLSFGKAAFKKVWGNRPLEDNWYLSNKPAKTTTIDSDADAKKVDAAYDVATYLNALPSSQNQINSLIADRNNALYQTGIIYKEQFKNLPLASQRFERLLQLNSNKELILPTKYHLYQIYKTLQDKRSDNYKAAILKEYPTSIYAKIIEDPTVVISSKSISQTEAIYKELYYMYKEGKFFDVSTQITELSPKIQESKLIAKFELLKALAIGKYQNKVKYLKALEFVASTYPNTEEGKRAKEIVKLLK